MCCFHQTKPNYLSLFGYFIGFSAMSFHKNIIYIAQKAVRVPTSGSNIKF